jgi:mono/diheme cytochrome c family protein
MAVLAFVLFFVLLGFGALFLGMSGGPKGARERMQTQSRRGRRGATLVFAVTIIVLGIAVPAAVVATEKARNSIPEANVKALTKTQERGRDLFGQRCRNCHTLKAAGASARVGPNLDDLAPPKALVLDAIRKGRARGNGNMAADLVQGADAEAVAQFVAVAVGQPATGK